MSYMYDFKKYKKVSYLVMYSSFNNMALSRNSGILNYMYNYCRAGDEGTSVCKDCKHSIKVKIPIGSCFAYTSLCIYCINRLFSVRSIIDDVFLNSTVSRSDSFRRIAKRCLYV